MTSPAAYLADLLEFLANSTPNAAGVTPLGVLTGDTAKGVIGRRPDLPFIPLTCENANTVMPYVDLVNEILEAYVVLGKLDRTVAHDTGKATAAELSANPQFTIDKAYDDVRKAVFPLSLPYDQAVDVMRAYLDHLGTSRYELLQRLDHHDGTLPPIAAQAAEQLGMSPNEFEVITGSHFDGSSSTLLATVAEAYGLGPKDLAPALAPGATGVAVRALQRQLTTSGFPVTVTGVFDAATQTALKAFQTAAGIPATGVPDATTWGLLDAGGPASLEVFLSSVPEFLRRTGIEYIDLIELLKTDYVNPHFARLQFLEDHGITFADVNNFASTGFVTPNTNIQNAVLDPAFGMTMAQFTAWITTRFASIAKFVVLRSSGPQCDLTNTELVRLDGTPVGEADWHRIHRFLRLRRRLGWSIRDVDRALSAFAFPDIDIALVIALATTQRLMTTLKLPLAPVLSIWSTLDTQGPDALHERLFRSRAMQKLDDSFMLNADRSELQTVGNLTDHVPALLAALRVSEVDLQTLRTRLGLDDPGGGVFALMNLSSLSLLYRHATLASGLRLSVNDFLTLVDVVPFNPVLPSPFGPANTELFVEAALKVRTSRFPVALLQYLLLGEAIPPATFEPTADTVTQLLVRLRAGLVQIAGENVPGDDPQGDRTRERLGILFEPNVGDQAVRMIDGSAVYTAPLGGLPPAFAFPAVLARRVAYDAKAGLLQITGVISTPEKAALKLLSAGMAAPLKGAYEKAIDAIFDQPRAFVKDVLGSRGVFVSVADAEARLFADPVVDQFGNPTWLDASGAVIAMDSDGNPIVPGGPPPVVPAAAEHFRFFLAQLLPFLRAELDRALVQKTVADALQLEPGLAQLLFERADVLHLDPLAPHPISDDLRALEGDGLLGTYFSLPGLAGATTPRIDPGIAFDFSSGSTVPGGATTPFSVRWTGWLLASTSGTHTFYLRSGGGARLTIDGVLVIDSFTAPPVAELQGTMALTAGEIYPVVLDFTTAAFEGVIEWRWSSPSALKTLVPRAQLYSTADRAAMKDARRAYFLMHRASLMLLGFAMQAADVDYIATHAADFSNVSLSDLPLAKSAPNLALFTQWTRLFDLAALRDQLPPGQVGGPSLVAVFGAAAASATPGALTSAVVAAFTALTGVDITEAATALGGLTDADLVSEIWLARVQALLDLSRLTGVTPATLADWVSTLAQNGPAEEIKRIVRARWDEETWPRVARPLNDVLRSHQRDALVAYLVARLGLENADQLYELLLIDVRWGPA